jgi:hypothetical protein
MSALKKLKFRIFDASRPVTEADVRELKAFLSGPAVSDERAFHTLLERHPALVGVLGFSEFSSEHPLYKRGADNEPILWDGRRRDRTDILAAQTSIIEPPPSVRPYKSAHLIELKSALTPISGRELGTRLSRQASDAMGELRDYKQWLMTVEENRSTLKQLGWDVRIPTLHLVMGTTLEFVSNPRQLDEIRGWLQEIGVFLLTVDELLARADRLVAARCGITSVHEWAIAPVRTSPSARLVAATENLLACDEPFVRFCRSEAPRLESYHQYLSALRQDFQGICAYCRTPDSLAGGGETFVVEHFRPRSKFPELAFSYDNLFYSCSLCNVYKAEPMADCRRRKCWLSLRRSA